MKRLSRKRGIVTEINITPFTDVILVLLVIFIVATPLIYQSSINVRLPRSSAQSKAQVSISLTINAMGEIFLEKEKYSIPAGLPALKTRLASLVSPAEESSIIIKGDREVKYDSVVRAIDAAVQAGIQRIFLATELKKENALPRRNGGKK